MNLLNLTDDEVVGWHERRLALIERLRSSSDMLDWCEIHTDLIDEAIRAVYESVLAGHPTAPPISIVATGGYGRKELAPYSDVDLTVVPIDDAAPGLDPIIRDLFRALHTAIGAGLKMEIGYAYRLVNDAPGLDETSRTSLLDARLVAGSAEPLDALMELYWESFPVGEFLLAKLEERKECFEKYNDTPLVVEPQVKEGAGGLRCFQCANWIRMAIGERPMRRSRAYNWMLQLRNQLHLAAGRRQDHFTRQRQAEVADMRIQDVYALTSECAQNAVALFEEFSLSRERIYESRFALGGGIVAIRGEARAIEAASLSAAAAGVARATQLGLSVPQEAFRTVAEVEGSDALSAIASGEKALRNLDRCGLLDQLLPEFTRCRTLIPRDSVHRYTVFEHTFRAILNLDELKPDSFLGELKSSLRDIGPLYLALLLHDAGKIDEERPHSVAGAELAREVSKRWKLDKTAAQTVEWLVREHLTMARFIDMRDMQNPQTPREFKKVVKTQERLDLLTILTFCDIKAVSKEALTQAQETFLAQLYRRTSALLDESSASEDDVPSHRRRILRELRGLEVSEAEVQQFMEAMPAHYLVSTAPELVQLHVRYEKQARMGRPVIEINPVPALSNSEMTVCCLDRPGLLSQILGVLYAYDLNIHAIRASTTNSSEPVALDVFNISFGGKPVPHATARRLIEGLRSTLEGSKSYEALLRERGKDPQRTQHNFTYTFVEGSPAILEIQAPKGRGMAYRISRVLAQQGWNISAARVGQWAGRGAAAFYVLGRDGEPVRKDDVDRAMRG